MNEHFRHLLSLPSTQARLSYALTLIYQRYQPNHCFIAEFVNDGKQACTLHYLYQGEIEGNFCYDLAGSPCQQASESNEPCYYPNSIKQRFPDDIALQPLDVEGYYGITLFSHRTQPSGILVCLFEQDINELKLDHQWLKNLSYLIGEELYYRQVINNKDKLLKALELSNCVFENTSEAIMITDKNNCIVSVNSSACQVMGYKQEELLGQNPSILSSRLHDANFYQAMWYDIKKHGCWSGEIYNKRKNGEIFPESLTINAVKDEHNNTSHYVAIFHDLTRWKDAEQRLFFYANRDPLTKLSNRRFFIDHLNKHIEQAQRSNSKFSLLLIDIAHFKDINDIYGEGTGDDILKQFADILLSQIPSVRHACRYGGDQFTLLAIKQDLDDVCDKAQRILDKVCKYYQVSDLLIEVSARIGIAQYPDSGESCETLLRSAQHALRDVKHQPGSCISLYDKQLQSSYLNKLALREQLKQAINQQQLAVYYQPIVCSKRNHIYKFEALVRFPDGNGFISPAEFIPVAEEYGLIFDIGEFVLKQSCYDLKQMRALGFNDICISINRSINEFRHSQQGEAISAAIAKAGLPYDAIVVEITESIAMSSNKYTQSVLSSLKQNGVKIALDDFGTGYSSLSNLIDYNADILKIDRSFINDICTDTNQQILTKSLITIATELGMEVIAEGVEDKAQVELLQQYGCNLIQGYYYSPARPFEQCIALLKQHNSCH